MDLISGLATHQNTTVSRRLTFDETHPHVSWMRVMPKKSPFLNLKAAVDYKDVTLGGEVGFDVVSASLTKYTAAIDDRSINDIDVCKPSYTKDVLMRRLNGKSTRKMLWHKGWVSGCNVVGFLIATSMVVVAVVEKRTLSVERTS
ncbi:hypothetical protein Tco_0233412 [Tanacetum coccineum]